jgi:hypothetical protein
MLALLFPVCFRLFSFSADDFTHTHTRVCVYVYMYVCISVFCGEWGIIHHLYFIFPTSHSQRCSFVNCSYGEFMFMYVQSSPFTGLEWPRGVQEVKVPRFHDNGTGRW